MMTLNIHIGGFCRDAQALDILLHRQIALLGSRILLLQLTHPGVNLMTDMLNNLLRMFQGKTANIYHS